MVGNISERINTLVSVMAVVAWVTVSHGINTLTQLDSCPIYARAFLECVNLIVWVRSVSKMLPSMKFMKDKVNFMDGFSPTAAFHSLPHPSGPNKTVLLLYKLLPKVLPVTTFHICNSAISFHFMCVCRTFCFFYVILTNCICICASYK